MDLAAQYNNRALVPDHERIISGWYADAAAYRGTVRADLDIVYGANPRNRVDIFHPVEAATGPLVVFIHGGYWRSLDKSAFSHMAAGANAHGFTVAVPTYSLCPEATIPDIVDELRQCCLFLHRRFGRQLVIAGHSAGGHLTACMAATGWSHFGADTPIVLAGFSISGIFDLRPLMATPLNADLKLTAHSAMVASPLLWPVPRGLPFDSWVGAKESQEFLRQSRSIAAAWTGLGMTVPHVEIPGANHFSVPADLADPDSAMTIRLVELANS